MEGTEVSDVLLVKGRTVLAVDAEGRWFGKSVGREPWSADDHLLWLLPILEQSPVDVVPAVEGASESGTGLLVDLVGFALGEGTDGWVDRAVTWLEAGYPADPFVDLLHELKDRAGLPQPLRHRVLRLWLSVRPRP